MKKLISAMIMALAVTAAVFAGDFVSYDQNGNKITDDVILVCCQNMYFDVANPSLANFDSMTYGMVGTSFQTFVHPSYFGASSVVTTTYKQCVNLTADWFKQNAGKKYTGPAAGYLNIWEPECRHALSNIGPKKFKHTRVIVVFAMKNGSVQWDTVKALPVYNVDEVLNDSPKTVIKIAEHALERATYYLEQDPNDTFALKMKIYAESYIKLGQAIEDAYVVTRVVFKEMHEQINALPD